MDTAGIGWIVLNVSRTLEKLKKVYSIKREEKGNVWGWGCMHAVVYKRKVGSSLGKRSTNSGKKNMSHFVQQY